MPDPQFLNMESGEATRADLADPSRRGLSLTQRVRALRGDVTDGSPLALIPLELDLSTNPTAAETVTLDGEVYEFVATSGAVANDANIAVEIGAGAADTFANFLAAVNGTADALHANITDVATTGQAKGVGTKPVFAADLGSQLLGLYYTGTQGLDVDAMTQDDYAAMPTVYPSFVVAETLTVGAWTALNFNLFPMANPSKEVNGMCALRIDVVTALLDVPFRVSFAGGTTLLGCVAQPKSATGVPVYWDAATFNVSGGDLIVDFDTGGTVDPANGEFVDIIVFGQFAGIQA